jgi:uncharacterized membrane protein YedE/YeeE
MSQPTATSLTQSSIHNALLHFETLLIGAILVASGFALSGLSTVHYAGLADFATAQGIIPAFIAGLLIAGGFVLAFSQQYLGFALMKMIQEYSTVVVAGILYMIGQFLIGFGNNTIPLQPLAGTILIIAGYVLVAVSIVLTGNTGLVISKLAPPTVK